MGGLVGEAWAAWMDEKSLEMAREDVSRYAREWGKTPDQVARILLSEEPPGTTTRWALEKILSEGTT